METLSLKGFVKDVRYIPCLDPETLNMYDIAQFDVNQVQAYGLINLGSSENNLAFSKWISLKRTRSYPFARIYNTIILTQKWSQLFLPLRVFMKRSGINI